VTSISDGERLLETVQWRRVGGSCGWPTAWELVQMKPEELGVSCESEYGSRGQWCRTQQVGRTQYVLQ
jgi:hypothetical protein